MNDVRLRRPSTLALLVAVLAAVLAAGAAGVAAHRSPGSQTSTALLSLDEPRAVAAAGDAGVLEKLSRIRLKYLGLVGTDRLAVPVASVLGVPVSQVRGRLSATASPADLLLRVSCSGPAARRCAQALATSLVAYVSSEQVTNGIPADQRLEAAVVQDAGPALAPASSRTRTLGLALVAGALAAAAVLAVAARPRR
ncbi:MAG: hypothetical protein ACXVGH_00115 [Mycobacteriales bacterium]